MRFKQLKLILFIFFFFVLLYIIYQFFYSINSSKTETALEYTSSDYIFSKGIFIRDEKLIDYDNVNIVNYIYENGEKVSKNTPICKVYNSSEDAINDNLVKYIDREIEILKKSKNPINGVTSQIDLLSKQIEDEHLRLTKSIFENDIKNVYLIRENILILKNRRDFILNNNINLDFRIETLEKYKENLRSKITSNDITINSMESGFFSNKIDGYEDILNSNILSDINVDYIKNILNKKNEFSSNKIGKIVTSTNSLFAIIVEDNDISKFKIGQTIQSSFKSSSNYTVNMTVEQIKNEKENKENIVVLSTDLMSKYIINFRKEDVKISFTNNTGLKINRKAVRIENDQKYVYVRSTQGVIKKKIDVIYENDDYILSKIVDDKDYLQLFDDVIIRGKDIYDK